jgi:hypothetical protein
MTTEDIPTASVPADIDAPDKITFGLTFRQLAILGTVAVAAWLTYRTFRTCLPPMAWLIAAIPTTAVTVVLALGRRDGLPLDLWLRHAVTLTRTPKIQTPGDPRPTTLAAVAGKPVVPAPLRTGVSAISPSGVLTAEGTDRVLIACGTTNVHLRTGDEQAALLDGFARWLNALSAPAQIVVAAQRHDLAPYAEAITATAARLPHPALRAAADDYADYLTDLDSSRDPLRRQVLAVVTGETARDTTVRALIGIGVTAVPLDGPAVAAALHAAVDPYAPVVPGRRAIPGTPITLRRPR